MRNLNGSRRLRALVLVDDPHQDEHEREEPDEVDEVPRLVSGVHE
jgi:hypothetical protein